MVAWEKSHTDHPEYAGVLQTGGLMKRLTHQRLDGTSPVGFECKLSAALFLDGKCSALVETLVVLFDADLAGVSA